MYVVLSTAAMNMDVKDAFAQSTAASAVFSMTLTSPGPLFALSVRLKCLGVAGYVALFHLLQFPS